MFKKLTDLDESCVLFFERICHGIQTFIGVSNFAIAKSLILLSVVSGINSKDGMFVQLSFAGVEILLRLYVVFYAESQTKVGSGIGFINPLRAFPVLFVLRVVFFGMLIVELFGGHRKLESLFVWLFYVIVVCTPLPPGTSKLGNWFRSLVPARVVSVPTRS